jgi:hypothetical protein
LRGILLDEASDCRGIVGAQIVTGVRNLRAFEVGHALLRETFDEFTQVQRFICSY